MKFLCYTLFLVISTSIFAGSSASSSSSSSVRQRRDEVSEGLAALQKQGLLKPGEPIAVAEGGVKGSVAFAEGEKGGNVIVKGSQVNPPASTSAPVPVPVLVSAPKEIDIQLNQKTNITITQANKEANADAYPEQDQDQVQVSKTVSSYGQKANANVSRTSTKTSFSTVTAQRGNVTEKRTNIYSNPNLNPASRSRKRTYVNPYHETVQY